jgi:hypothetical protein
MDETDGESGGRALDAEGGAADTVSAAPAQASAGSVAGMLGLLVGCVAYVTGHALRIPLPTYLPVEGRWSLSPPPGAIAMGYFGLVALGSVGFVLGYAIGRSGAASRRLRRAAAARRLVSAVVLVVVASLAYVVAAELS